MNGSEGLIRQTWRQFVDLVAQVVEYGLQVIAPGRGVRVEEIEGGRFTVQQEGQPAAAAIGHVEVGPQGVLISSGRDCVDALRNARVTLVFKADRFLSREMTLPAQARDFVDRILRAQIDRLTPWSPDQALFGHTSPQDAGDNRMTVGVVAADRRSLEPTIEALRGLKPKDLWICAAASARTGAPEVRLVQEALSHARGAALRSGLGALALGVIGVAVAASLYTSWAASSLDEELAAIQAQIAAQRADLRAIDPLAALEQALIKRKVQGPVATLVVEDLSRLLPDDTWLTSLSIDGPKVQINGVSRDATALVRVLESSGAMSDTNFFAPTTRDAQESGEKFHIEATLRPRQGSTP